MLRTTAALLSAAALVAVLLAVLAVREADRARPPRPVPSAGPVATAVPVLHPADEREPLASPDAARSVPASRDGRPEDAPFATGRLTLGWVLDPDGRPVEGARVTPWRSNGLERRLDPALAAWSDASGRFGVLCDSLGASALRVEHPLYLPFEGVPTDWPVLVRLRAPVPVALRVLDGRGAPVGGARVRSRADDPRAAWQQHRTDADGRVVLPAAGAPALTVAVEAEGGRVDPVRLELPLAAETVLTLVATRARAVRVVDAAGAPLRAARVVCLAADAPRARADARTDADGTCRVDVPADGTARLLAEHPDGWFRPVTVGPEGGDVVLRSEPCGVIAVTTSGGPCKVELRDPGAPETPPMRLVARPDRTTRLALPAGPWIATWAAGSSVASPATREVRLHAGRETRLTIEAPAAATLDVTLGGPHEGVIGLELAAEDTRTTSVHALDASGCVRVEALAPGRYTLALLAEGGGRWVEPGLVVLAPGETRHVELAPVLATRALLVRTAGGIPLATASARLASPVALPGGGAALSGERVVERATVLPFAGADEAGCVRLALCPSGPARVRVEAPGFTPTEVVLEGAATLVDLQREDT